MKRRPLWRTRASTGTVLLRRDMLSVFKKKYSLKKPGDFTVSEGHRYPLVST
jgi:hypothetical protein